MIRLIYQGRKPYRDKFMRLQWLPGAVHLVTEDAAKRLLRFGEFAKAQERQAQAQPGQEPEAQAAQQQAQEMEAAQLAAQQQALRREQEEEQMRALLLTVDGMDKDALEAYAAKYEVNLDKRRSVQALRQEVATLIEQYGAR